MSLPSTSDSAPLRFAAIGAGFWARFQLAAWRETAGARCVAICDRDRPRAERLARELDIAHVDDDAERMLRDVGPDFVEVITSPGAHVDLARMAIDRGIPVIVQKPLAESLADAEEVVGRARTWGVPLFVHENWRWQTPIRALGRELAAGTIGRVFRARIAMVSGFPVFQNQPYLKSLERFLLADMGVHILDVARFLFGEAESVYCHAQRVHADIRGEDVATVMLRMRTGATVVCDMGYAENFLERDRFPETLVFVEGERGSAELAGDFWLRVTTAAGTHSRRVPPPRFAWADPAYDVVHASMVPCQRDILAALRGEAPGETRGEDNIATLRLVFGAYESAATGAAQRAP